MDEFDFTRALSEGKLVVLRDGGKAKILSRFDYKDGMYIGVTIESKPISMIWDRFGRPFTYRYDDYVPTEHDIVGYDQTYKTIHGVRIKSFDFVPKHRHLYFLPTPTYKCLVTSFAWNEDDPDCRYQLKMGLLYPCTKEGKDEAAKHAKAMLGIED